MPVTWIVASCLDPVLRSHIRKWIGVSLMAQITSNLISSDEERLGECKKSGTYQANRESSSH